MHCCLITAPTVTEFRSREELMGEAVQLAAGQPQLGVLTVAAVLESCGIRPAIIDANSAYLKFAEAPDRLKLDSFAQYLAELAVQSNADLYGFSSICSTYPLSIRVSQAVKKLRPYSMVLFGGPQASVVDADTMAAFPFVDFVLRGEVEQSLPSLLQELQRDYDYSRVPGLTYREGTTVKRNPNAPVIDDLDSVPSPAYHLSNYLRNAKAASVELGRGCPFSCRFCSTNDFFRRKFRLRSPTRVLKEMRDISAAYGVRHFELVHDMFTVDRKRVVAFCEEMLASGDAFTWDCSARTDCVDRDLLELMVRSGCRNVFFGIETGSQRMQRVIDKDLDLERASEMLTIAEELHLGTTVSLITGFPEEEVDDIRGTLRVFGDAARHSRSRPQLNILAPLAGTPIHAAHKHEMVLEDLCSDMSHQGLSQNQEDLELIRRFPEIFPNFYLIPVKALDRDVLFELREFLSMSLECFRWLLCSIDQTTDLFSFHLEWRAWRENVRGNLIGWNLRRYYVGDNFRIDFLRFLKEHPLAKNPAILALVRVEMTMKAAGEQRLGSHIDCDLIALDEPVQMEDIPHRRPGTRLLKLDCKLDEVVSALANRTDPARREATFYATRVDEGGHLRLVEISPAVAAVVKLCDRKRTVRDIVAGLAENISDLDEELRDYASRRLLMGVQQAGFIHLYQGGLTRCASPARRRRSREEAFNAGNGNHAVGDATRAAIVEQFEP